MTVLSLTATDINFDRNQSALVETIDSASFANNNQPTITKFEISNIADVQQDTNVQPTSIAIPTSLKIAYWSFGVVSLFFLLQFVLTFFGTSMVSGFSGLVGFVGFGGLFKVVQRIHNEICQKGFIQ